MSLHKAQHTAIEAHQRERGDDSEPLYERTVTVQGAGYESDTPYVTPTRQGAELIGVEIGDDVRVKVFDEMLIIHAAD
jgi:hypothetical protein